MKQLTSYNRVCGYLNKIFDLLNAEFFNNELVRPTITVQSTPRAYGHFSLRDDTWISVTGSSHEINIGAGTLARPIELVCTTLCHEMVHYFNYYHNIKDTSRGNTYHNKAFRDACLFRGMLVERSNKYGWSHTSPGEPMLDFVLKNELTDILINRNEFYGFQITGTGAHSGTDTTPPTKTSNSRKYQCPCCKNSVRATKVVNIVCGDCGLKMELA